MRKGTVHIRYVVLIFVLLLGSAGLCCAEDFTFNVPVALYNIPAQYTAAKINCLCTNRNIPQNTKMAQYAGSVGYGSKDLPIMNGTCVGTAVVRFNAASGANPADATDWECVLFFFEKSSGKWHTADKLMYNAYNRSKPYKTSDRGYLK